MKKLMCPKCIERLRTEQYRHREYRICFYCEGLWLNHAQISEHGILIEKEKIGDTKLSCPSCEDVRLELVSSNGVQVEECPQCHGAFFDKNEIDQFYRNYQSVDSKELAADVTNGVFKMIKFSSTVLGIFRTITRLSP
ncbi:hypothetical protein BTA51_03530 [Hahella sp. CCB-MM4]|uniref:TFIIB-type zinc ribbon-containing protein n=1 Tax=Hahella sp. (strain CCB-MM4) TaxID=1926491 RepID=UPI000B9AB5E3|nr:zf-TFIIB domain-containing protein [Hahella sp. CCB-MM4]OZG75456.1 hypothetical protein BTA51_03530 [Hahella sp. CCB-MM4]